MNKDTKDSQSIFYIIAVILLALVVIVARGCIQGTEAFLSDEGGRTWLLVIGGLALFVYLVYRANK